MEDVKKILFISAAFLIFFSIFALASGTSVFNLQDNLWIPLYQKTNSSKPLASPHSSPNSPSTVATPLVYVHIEYTKISAHVDVPGEWMMGNINITTIASNTPIIMTFSTSGNLRNGSLTIPTYYQKYDGNSNYIPNQPLHAAVWKAANKNWPIGMNGYQLTRRIGNHSLKLWIGVNVRDFTKRGRYTGWIQISIAQVP